MVRRGISVRPGGNRPGLPMAAAVLTALAGLAMAGCASDGEAVALPSLKPQTAAATASPSGTTDQAEADQRVEVEDAVRAYFAAANLAVSTGETGALEALTAASCPCTALIKTIQRTYATGSAPEASWHLMSVESALPENSIALATAQYIASEYAVLDREGVEVQRFPGHRNQALIQLARVRGRWMVVNFDNSERVAL